MARVYELEEDQLHVDERLVLLVLAESISDELNGFAHKRSEIAGKCGFAGDSERALARRLRALEAAGFISQKREKNTRTGEWTGRIYVELTIEAGGQTERGAAGSRTKRPTTSRDDAGRFHSPSATEDGPSTVSHGGRSANPSTVSDGGEYAVSEANPSTVSEANPSTVSDGGESPEIDPKETQRHLSRPTRGKTLEEERRRQITALQAIEEEVRL